MDPGRRRDVASAYADPGYSSTGTGECGGAVAARLAEHARHEPARSRATCRLLDAAPQLHRDRTDPAEPARAVDHRRVARDSAARTQSPARGGRLRARVPA